MKDCANPFCPLFDWPPGVDGGSIPFPSMLGVDTAMLVERLNCPGRIAGEFRASSLFTGTAAEVVGESTDPDTLLALSSWSKFGIGVADVSVPPKRFLRPAPLTAGALLFVPFVCGAGDPAGLPLAAVPNLRVIRGAASGTLSLILVPAGSGTACFASFNFL